MRLAEFLGEDARKVRAIGLRDRHPELFQGRYDDLLDTLNDHDRACLKILREVPMENPKMQEALKFLLEGFVEAYKRQKEEASPTQPAEQRVPPINSRRSSEFYSRAADTKKPELKPSAKESGDDDGPDPNSVFYRVPSPSPARNRKFPSFRGKTPPRPMF